METTAAAGSALSDLRMPGQSGQVNVGRRRIPRVVKEPDRGTATRLTPPNGEAVCGHAYTGLDVAPDRLGTQRVGD